MSCPAAQIRENYAGALARRSFRLRAISELTQNFSSLPLQA